MTDPDCHIKTTTVVYFLSVFSIGYNWVTDSDLDDDLEIKG